jgi:multiple sugar transport system permease protein
MRRWVFRLAIYAAAIAVLLVFLAPIAWMVDISLKTRAQIFAWPPSVFSFAPTLDNYRALFAAGSNFPRFVLNSIGVALASTALALAVGLPAAYALVGTRLRHAAAMRAGVLLFRMIPPVALLLPYYLMFREIGLVGHPAAIAISHFTFSIAIVVWMMRGAFASLPASVEEAARVDGAMPRQVFWFIALPMARAAAAASAIFAVLTSWNEFLFAVTLSRLQTQTVPVAVAGFVGDVYVSWGQLAAATVVGLLPALALAFLGQRWLLVGMGPGAVK